MSQTPVNVTVGTSFSSLLGLAFIVLKLTHIIDWSWWWVTVPFWIPFGLGALFLLGAAFFGLIYYIWRKTEAP